MVAARILLAFLLRAGAEQFVLLELYTDRSCSSKAYQSYHYPGQRIGSCQEDPRPGLPDNLWFKAEVVSGYYSIDYFGADSTCTEKTERRTVAKIGECIEGEYDYYKFRSRKWTIQSSGFYQETVFPFGLCTYKERHLEMYKMLGYCQPFHSSVGSMMSVCEHGEVVQMTYSTDNCTGNSSKLRPRLPPNVCVARVGSGVINHGCPDDGVNETSSEAQHESTTSEDTDDASTRSTTLRQRSAGVGEIDDATRVAQANMCVNVLLGLIATSWLCPSQKR